MGFIRPLQPFRKIVIPAYSLIAPLFDPVERLPFPIADLNGRLLADVLDATLTYGVVGEEFDDRVLHLQYDNRHLFVRASHPDELGITHIQVETSIKKMRVTNATHYHIVCPNGSVFWPHTVKVSDIRDGLHDADARMSDSGFIDVDTGVRTSIYSPYAKGKIKVADYFSLPETTLRYPPNGLPTEVFLKRFDEPDALARICLKDGSVRICLSEEADLIQQKDEIRWRVRNSLRRKHGISTDAEIERLTEAQRLAFEREMYVETQREFARLPRG